MFDDSVKHPADFSQDSNMSESGIPDLRHHELNGLNAMIEAIEEDAKDRVQQLKETIRYIVNDIIQSAEDAQGAINTLYWEYPFIHASMIAEAGRKRGLKGSAHTMAGEGYVELTCPRCLVTFEKALYSRSSYVYEGELCAECKEQREQETESRYADIVKQREEYINWLKTMPYADYLQTEHWQEVRKRALKRAGFACQLCNKRTVLHVHHRTYENRGAEENRDLIVLCANCHSKFHDKLAEVE